MTVCTLGPKVFGKKNRHLDPGDKPKFAKGGQLKLPVGATGGFDYPTQLVGSTPDGRCTVYYDPSLGSDGQKNAQDVLNWANKIYLWHDALFGYKGGNHNVIVAPDFGGAYHYGCDFTNGGDLYLSYAPNNSALVAGLYAAELSEAYMQDSANPNQNPFNCGYSTGEALSRRCANETCDLIGSKGAMEQAGYGAASSWDGSDWISRTDQTDQNYVSTGAGMVAIDWLIKAGYPLYKIVGSPADTFESVYQSLTGKTGFYSVLRSAVNGLPGGVQNDEPFTGSTNPGGAIPSGPSPSPSPPPPPPGPTPQPQPGGSTYTGSIIYTYLNGILVDVGESQAPTPTGTATLNSVRNDLSSVMSANGISPNIITDALKLITDITTKAPFVTDLADIMQIIVDLRS